MSTPSDLGYTTPGQARSLRACMVCSVVQLYSRFLSHGCPNCEAVLNLTNAPEAIAECTSANFNGVMAVMEPSRSWVARWQRVDGYIPGVYAVQVVGELPYAYVQDLGEQGVRYVPRDGPREEEGEQV